MDKQIIFIIKIFFLVLVMPELFLFSFIHLKISSEELLTLWKLLLLLLLLVVEDVIKAEVQKFVDFWEV